MEKLANKLTFSSEGEELDDVEELKSTTLTKVEEKGKIPLEQDIAQGSIEKKNAKKPKLAKESILHIVQHPTSKITVAKGK